MHRPKHRRPRRRRRLSAPLLLPLACLLGALCACDAEPESSATTDLTGMLHPGTKDLVVKNPFGNRPTFFDFDVVSYGTIARHTFEIENELDRPVTILDALPSCGCLRPTLRYVDARGDVVQSPPGHEKSLTVPPRTRFDLVCEVDTTFIEAMNVDKLVQVRLRTDAPSAPFLAFEMHLIVERPFRAVPAILELGEIAEHGGKSMRCDISAERPGSGETIVAVARVDGPFTASVDKTTNVAGEVYWMLHVTSAPGTPRGPVDGKVVLSTTDPAGDPGAPFEVPVHGRIVADVTPHPGLFAFGGFPAGERRTCKVTLDAVAEGERFAFLGAQLDGIGADKIELKRTPLDPDAQGRARSWTIELTTHTDFPFGAFSGTVAIETDHPRTPKVSIPYTGNAQ